ncbi:YtcA family lipoprotein [Telmatobacter bradus]|uniref:YtcA family lipoprotein n=1 Tax=Telmatobacter bradus TaxID=474953 RepID=UPI003B433B5F
MTSLVCCCGCSRAPAVDILGSFFPAWMICVSLAVVASGLTHWLLVRMKVEKEISFPILFYPSLMVAFACLLWLLLFR